ncbi:pirin family protein [Flaviaesturariibacter flavus]|nr:pirin family protein [Flaviaesturariibacter flavus]
MKNEISARIYRGAARGLTDNGRFRSYNTFPFGSYKDADKPPFGPLYLLNDETLAPEQQLRLQPEERTLLLLLPVTGAVDYRDTAGHDALLAAGEAGLFTLDGGSSYRVRNPYDAALVHYLQLWIAWPAGAEDMNETIAFDLTKQKNQLVEIRHSAGADHRLALHIGRFDRRQEGTVDVGDGNRLFVFVVQGDFKVADRLLDPGDGLALTQLERAGFEAMSDDAILLLATIGPVGPGLSCTP